MTALALVGAMALDAAFENPHGCGRGSNISR